LSRVITDIAEPIRADDGVVVTTELLERVGDRILEAFPRYYPASPFDRAHATIRLDRLGETSSYPLFAATVVPGTAGTPRELIVKFAPVFSENNEGLTEYRHLLTMHERLGNASAIRVPRPLDFYEDVNALVMEKVGGERFSRVLLRDGGRFAPPEAATRLRDAARRCGGWLAAYHDATRHADAAPFDDTFVARIDEKLAAFGALGFAPSAARTVAATVRRLHEFGVSRRVPVADQHGDYGPQNAHVGDGFVYVFDLNYHVAAPVYDDIDYFLVTLETMNPYPRQWFLDRGRVAAMRTPFLEGYFAGAAADPARDVYLEGYYIKSLLFRCAKQRRNTTRRGRAALALFDALRLRGYYARRLVGQCRRAEERMAAMPGGGAR
jgi:hypothetical protein